MDFSSLPDRPLVVKCAFDKSNKKITFASARNCSFAVLKEKVEKCFSLRSSIVSWKDDDGETTHIVSDPDLAEAVQYFCSGDDAPLSSTASILSGRSFGSKKITLRVTITVDYDGPSLSDTSSLASLEEYQSKDTDRRSFHLNGRTELEDDAITVSSRDPTGPASSRSWAPSTSSSQEIRERVKTSPTVQYQPKTNGSSDWDLSFSTGPSSHLNSYHPSAPSELASALDRYPADPSAVFARLKLQEEFESDGGSDWESIQGEDRGARWLREQKERVIRSRLGALPEPSISEDSGSFDDLSGDLSLERNNSGRYYYTYNASASGSQTHVSTDEDGLQVFSDHDGVQSIAHEKAPMKPRPTSRHLNWLVEQQLETEVHRKLQSSASHSSLPRLKETPPNLSPYLDDNYMLYTQLTSPPPEILTDCSACGALLDSIRYVCSICGEKPPIGSANHTHPHHHQLHSYPPRSPASSPRSATSQLYVGSAETVYYGSRTTLGPPNPFDGSSSAFSSQTQLNPTAPHGYELCGQCFQESGIHHAIEAGASSPTYTPSQGLSPLACDSSSTWRRTAPKKGQLRHAFQEKIWGDFGWEDIAQDESAVSVCSICRVSTVRQRYKCAACPNFYLCRSCYSMVHDIHPNDAFILVPDAPSRMSETESSFGSRTNSVAEQSLEHPGVSCSHCLLPIVGARFHCAICDSVDICSNCEGAGLPGNLDSADGGHNSSHILIKIPVPLEGRELENASRRALHLWQGRDAAVAFSASRSAAQAETLYAQTIIGSASTPNSSLDHMVPCSNCNQNIFGVRYQCAHCPSRPNPYTLCSSCDARSWAVHDPMHIFFKLLRPIDQSRLESTSPFLPLLYDMPAGPVTPGRVDDPRAYLRTLIHKIALCDKCMTPIEGEWFRCANCSKDLCDHCESLDTHADNHVFIVFKSNINMPAFKAFTNPDNPVPVISWSVYDRNS